MNTAQMAGVDDVTIDLGVILRALWRARWRLLLLTLAVAVAAFVGLSSMTPSYKSDTRVVIETREMPIGDPARQTEAERAILDEQGIGSQVQLLTSRDIARRVIASLGLADDPEFVSRGLLRSLLATLGLGAGRDAGGASPEEKVLETFFEHLNVYQVEKTRVIQVEFSSSNPDKAARIATAIVAEYLKAAAEAKERNSAEATRFLSDEIAQLRRRVADAEAKVEQYRSGADLFVGQNNVRISEQQLGEMNTQLTAAKALRSETEARVRQLKRLLDGGGNLETASEVASSPIVQRLLERRVALRARAAELATTYLPNHPQVRAVEAQVADVDTQVRAEARKVLAGYENDLRVTEGRVKQLGAQFNEFKSQAAKAGEEDIQLRALEREAKVQRDQLEAFLARYRDELAKQLVGAQPADARVISAAAVPVKPAFPKVVPLTTVIALATFLLGCTWIVLREFLSGAVLRRTAVPVEMAGPPPVAFAPPSVAVPEPAAAAPPPPVLAASTAPVEPVVDPVERPAPVPPEPVAEDEASPIAEGPVDGRVSEQQIEAEEVAHLEPPEPSPPTERESTASLERLWADLAEVTDDGQRILVTSATGDHAAHLAALALLRVAAKRGAKVCLLDLTGDDDLADRVAIADRPGLSELLAGEARFADVIFRDRASRGHVVLRGRADLAPADLEGEDFRAAMEALDLTYDHLIVDIGRITPGQGTADLVASAEAVVLAADGSGRDPDTRKAHAALVALGLDRVRVLAVDDGDTADAA